MGIVNVTPDSFSDGGRYFDPEAAIAHARELVAEGADLLDVGGESTRPNATPVSEAEELRRILPVIEELARQVTVPLSIDTRKTAVARAALAAGASLVNDVEARRSDDALWRVVADAQAGYVCMHMQGTPATMQQNPSYTDVVREVGEFFTDRLARLARCGVAPNQVALDVGIGSGKDLDHNLICSPASNPIKASTDHCCSAFRASPFSVVCWGPTWTLDCRGRRPAPRGRRMPAFKCFGRMTWRPRARPYV